MPKVVERSELDTVVYTDMSEVMRGAPCALVLPVSGALLFKSLNAWSEYADGESLPFHWPWRSAGESKPVDCKVSSRPSTSPGRAGRGGAGPPGSGCPKLSSFEERFCSSAGLALSRLPPTNSEGSAVGIGGASKMAVGPDIETFFLLLLFLLNRLKPLPEPSLLSLFLCLESNGPGAIVSIRFSTLAPFGTGLSGARWSSPLACSTDSSNGAGGDFSRAALLAGGGGGTNESVRAN